MALNHLEYGWKDLDKDYFYDGLFFLSPSILYSAKYLFGAESYNF